MFKNRRRAAQIVFCAVLSLATSCFAEPRSNAFVPPPGKVLLIFGQTVEDIQAYQKDLSVTPGGWMAYTAVQRAQGLTLPFNEGDGAQFAQKVTTISSNTVLQLGLWMVDGCEQVIRGDLDATIDQLGAWIQSTHRPVYLRVGYEFDAPFNHYSPLAYVQAYRHIVGRLRKNGVTNIAYVWHSFASPIVKPLTDWYPGDDYVDWFGISYFNQPQRYMQPMLDLAKQHAKPVMIAESSPWVVQTKYANSWNLWFAPLFKFMAANDIRAFCYIGCNWDSLRQFQHQKWGDTRLQSNPDVLKRWSDETSRDKYLTASPTLFKILGYDSPVTSGLANDSV